MIQREELNPQGRGGTATGENQRDRPAFRGRQAGSERSKERSDPGRTNPPEQRCRSDESDSNAQYDDDQIGLGIVAVLQRVVPLVEHLQDGSADANGQDDCREEPSHAHNTDDNTRLGHESGGLHFPNARHGVRCYA